MPMKGPFTLTASMVSSDSAFISSMGSRMLMPALLIRISRHPLRSTTTARAFSQLASEVTSSRTKKAVPPLFVIAPAVFVPSGSSRSAIKTVAPSSEKRRAIAAPIPRAAPVTRAVLFFSRMGTLLSRITQASHLSVIPRKGRMMATLYGIGWRISRIERLMTYLLIVRISDVRICVVAFNQNCGVLGEEEMTCAGP